MIWKALGMSSCTSFVELYLGKASKQTTKETNTKESKRKNLQLQLKCSAKATLLSSQNI